MKSRFSIIIVHRNGRTLIEHCLTALSRALAGHDEVTVVDNGSTDDSTNTIGQRFGCVKLIENGCNNGFAAANNQVLRDADASYFLLLNSDALIGEGALDQFATLFESDPDIAVITPQLIGSDGSEQRSYGFFMRPLDEILPRVFRKTRCVDLQSSIVDVDTVVGACMAVRKAAMDEVGLLDEDFFFYFEETEWCFRFKKHGYRVVLDRGVKVVHDKGQSTRPFRKEARLELFKSRLVYYRKVFDVRVAFALCVYRIVRLVMNSIFATLALVLTLGLSATCRAKWRMYAFELSWIMLGKPRHWGLPDKCPVGYGHEDSA